MTQNEYMENIRREERISFFWYKLRAWTLALLVTGAAAWAIVYIIQHPNHKTEQHESDKHNLPI